MLRLVRLGVAGALVFALSAAAKPSDSAMLSLDPPPPTGVAKMSGEPGTTPVDDPSKPPPPKKPAKPAKPATPAPAPPPADPPK